MRQFIEFIEHKLGIKYPQFIERNDHGYHFVGFKPEGFGLDDESILFEVSILFTETNHVYVNGELQNVALPFDVWSADIA